jgi:hypothetical protein
VPGFAEVRFKGIRKDYFSVPGLSLSPGDPVIVEADRGEDLGTVTALGSIAERKCSASGLVTFTPNSANTSSTV